MLSRFEYSKNHVFTYSVLHTDNFEYIGKILLQKKARNYGIY